MYKEKRLSRSEYVPIRGLNYHVLHWGQAPQVDAMAASAGPPQARPAPPSGQRGSESPQVHAVGNVGVPLVLVHGWMDVAASYQFVVDALSDAFAQGRTILAPDWRGYGKTGTGGILRQAQDERQNQATSLELPSSSAGAADPALARPEPDEGPVRRRSAPSGGSAVREATSVGAPDSFWFPDYLADLDFLLDHYAPGQAVDLVGHSMGGNVAMLYAGVRPERIRKLVNLEGFGLPQTQPAQAPARFAQWMDELKSLHKGEMALKPYKDADGVARRLMRTNPRLTQDKADWLARHWAAPDAQGQWRILGDAAHKLTSAQIYRLDEVLEIYRCISAPTLAVEASDDSLGKWWDGKYTLDQHHERLRSVPQVRTAVVQDAGHMLHHDQPAQVAALIESFLTG